MLRGQWDQTDKYLVQYPLSRDASLARDRHHFTDSPYFADSVGVKPGLKLEVRFVASRNLEIMGKMSLSEVTDHNTKLQMLGVWGQRRFGFWLCENQLWCFRECTSLANPVLLLLLLNRKWRVSPTFLFLLLTAWSLANTDWKLWAMSKISPSFNICGRHCVTVI